MKQKRLNRRELILGSYGIAISLPFLEIMDPGRAKAQGQNNAKNFIAVYTPGGTVPEKWECAGQGNNFTLSPILSPLAPVKNKILIPSGIDMNSAIGEQHQAGIVALLTGTPQSKNHSNFAGGPSIDQVIARKIGSKNRFKSIEIAIRWATGKSRGLLHPINSLNFEDNEKFTPISPRIDPVAIFNELFTDTIDAGANFEAAQQRLRMDKSILDFVGKRYQTLGNRLGSEDKKRLDQHLTKIRQIEQSLKTVATDSICKPFQLPDTSGYNAKSGLNSAANGSIIDAQTDQMIPAIGKLMMDMIVMAMSCDLTRVATLQWTDTEAKHTFPWLNLKSHHHFYQHDGGFQPEELQKIGTWYAKQHAYLLEEMDKVNIGESSLLDNSVVFFGSELAHPSTHKKKNMPLILAGKGGGLKSGQLIKFTNASHNDLLVSILNCFGDQRNTFGDTRFSSSALPGIT